MEKRGSSFRRGPRRTRRLWSIQLASIGLFILVVAGCGPSSGFNMFEYWEAIRPEICTPRPPDAIGDLLYEGLRWDEDLVWDLQDGSTLTGTEYRVTGLSQIAAAPADNRAEPTVWVVAANVLTDVPQQGFSAYWTVYGSLETPSAIRALGPDVSMFPPEEDSDSFSVANARTCESDTTGEYMNRYSQGEPRDTRSTVRPVVSYLAIVGGLALIGFMVYRSRRNSSEQRT